MQVYTVTSRFGYEPARSPLRWTLGWLYSDTSHCLY